MERHPAGLHHHPPARRFWDERTGNIKTNQDVGRQIFENNFPLDGVIMSCNDQSIANALQSIAAALSSQNSNSNATAIAQCGGCGGSSGVNNSTISVQAFVTLPDGTQWPIMGTQPIAELPESGYPDGYENQAEYDTDKCAKATKMANDFINSIENFATVNWIGGVVGAAAILACLVGLITVPYAAIPLLLFALCGNIGITAALSAFADELQNRRQDLICILYEGDTVSLIITQMAEFLDVVIATIHPASAIAVVLKNIGLWLMNGDVLNYLFNSAARQAYPSADCSACEPCPTYWDFEDGLQGWFIQEDNGSGSDIAWDNGELSMTYNPGVAAPGARIQSPSISYIIQPGDVLHCKTISTVSYSFAIFLLIGGNEVEVSNTGVSQPGTVSDTFDLSAWEGQTIQGVRVYAGKATGGGGWYMKFDNIGIPCF
ncbi:MAG: hypothetical protein HC875_36240 [Anaerolineales bacterium]|nr:hypothetical protein [Anaerolineales bacterium]